MSDLGQAYVQIVPKATGISNKISKLLGNGSDKAGRQAGASIGSGIKKAIVAAGIGAAIGGAIKSAVSEGGKIEQSFGGLETIYGKASDQAKVFAWNAAKAGISANDYAEQAVSFGASLKQAFGGNTTKAVKAANTAIMDMTDNAAKMGTPIENIQNAYQGFAKQNYTMLDNLKLGYGGTKTEMERLLADAEKFSGQKYDIGNLGDVYDAIHVIQGELGLTGVAAKEANETLSGSFGALKADWKNLLGMMATGGEEVGAFMAEVVDSASVFLFDNLIPMIGNVLSNMPEVIGTFFSEAGPKLMETGKSLLNGLIDGINTYAPKIMEAIPSILQKIGQGISNNAPALIAKGGELIKNLVQGITTYGPQILSTIGSMVSDAIKYLSDNLPEWAKKGGEMIGHLAQGIIEKIPDLLKYIVENLETIIPALLKAGFNLIKGIAEGVGKGIASLIGPAVRKLIDAIKRPINALKGVLSGIWNSIKTTASTVWDGIKTAASRIWGGIKTAVMTPIKNLKKWLSDIWDGIKTTASRIWEDIKSAITQPIESAKKLIEGMVNAIKKLFPIDVGNIFKGVLKLPKIWTESHGKSAEVKYNIPTYYFAKAMNQPFMFDTPTFFGAGEAGDEMLYGRRRLMNDMQDVVQKSMNQNNGDVIVNLNYNASDDADVMLRDLARGIRRYKRAGAF